MPETNQSVTSLSETISQLMPGRSLTPEQKQALDERAARHQSETEARERGKRVADVAAALGRRYSPEAATLASFAVYHPEQKAVLARLQEFSGHLAERVAAGISLILYGTVGTGKDHLLAALLYEAARQGFSCRWANGQDIYGRFRDAIDGGQRESEILAEYAAPQVLAISDPIPPAAPPTPYNLQQLFRLLDRRYRDLKPTWVSMNALSLQDADAKLSQPIFDRLRDGAELVRCFWPSYRERSRAKSSA